MRETAFFGPAEGFGPQRSPEPPPGLEPCVWGGAGPSSGVRVGAESLRLSGEAPGLVPQAPGVPPQASQESATPTFLDHPTPGDPERGGKEGGPSGRPGSSVEVFGAAAGGQPPRNPRFPPGRFGVFPGCFGRLANSFPNAQTTFQDPPLTRETERSGSEGVLGGAGSSAGVGAFRGGADGTPASQTPARPSDHSRGFEGALTESSPVEQVYRGPETSRSEISGSPQGWPTTSTSPCSAAWSAPACLGSLAPPPCPPCPPPSQGVLLRSLPCTQPPPPPPSSIPRAIASVPAESSGPPGGRPPPLTASALLSRPSSQLSRLQAHSCRRPSSQLSPPPQTRPSSQLSRLQAHSCRRLFLRFRTAPGDFLLPFSPTHNPLHLSFATFGSTAHRRSAAGARPCGAPGLRWRGCRP